LEDPVGEQAVQNGTYLFTMFVHKDVEYTADQKQNSLGKVQSWL